ncbi:restriction endonuclease subunit S [Staphylococcus borealis]|uniref:restriction endonuclease subunit S n=2 Tax=Staphylococcus borealis TaxID=2742203 RepID=UPI0031340E78
MTEPQNTPELRFPEFKNEWKIEKLGDLANIVRGASPRPIKDSKWFDDNSDVGWLRISDVTQQNGKIKFLQQHLSTEGQKKTRVLYKPHLLLSIAASVGKPVINYVKTGVHDGFLIFMNPKFNLYFMFNWLEYFQLKWNKYGQPGSQVNLNSDLVKSQSIYIPDSYEEEKKIGEFFSKLDRHIELEEEKLELLEAQKKSYMQMIFTQKIRFKDENGNNYPNWKSSQLGEITKTFSGGTPKSNNSSYYNGDIPFIRSGEISKQFTELKISENALNNSSAKLVEKGDLLYALYGATSGEVAISKIHGAINQAVLCIKSEESINFLLNFLRLQKQHILKTYIQGGQGNLSASIVKGITIKLPCREEQTKIGNFLDKVEILIEKQSFKVDLLKQRKQGLLQKMFV